jgi:hypothetical protein
MRKDRDDKPFPPNTVATIGMLVTREVGTDSYGGVCVDVKACGKTAVFKVGNRLYTCTLRSDGRYREVGRRLTENNVRWVLGVSVDHLDPHF